MEMSTTTTREAEAAAVKEERESEGGFFVRAETALRVVPLGLSLAALVVMLKNSQDSQDYGTISYSDLGAFRYLVYASAACAAYSLLSAFLAATSTTSLFRSWSVFILDQVVTYLLLAAGAVGAEVLYLVYNGDEEVTWSKECGVFSGFCRRATTSVSITFASMVCYALLCLISSYRLFSTFDAPGFLDGKGAGAVEIAPFAG